MTPIVSIIIPCYNCEKYIEETLQHLEAQTFKDYEVLCINDGSSDGTLSILESWQKRINMTIICQDNAGVSAARNRGIAESKGKYIMFCDADDYYHPKMVELLVFAAEKNSADTVYCFLSRDKNKVFEHQAEIISEFRRTQAEAMSDLLYKMGSLGFYCYIYSAEIIRRIGLKFDTATKNFEDREFNWKYLANCYTIFCINEALYFYRRTENSATRVKIVEWRTDRIDAAKRVEKYLEQKECLYYGEVKKYLVPRVIWGTTWKYATGASKEYFKRMQKEYNVRDCMQMMIKDGNKKVSILSKLYLINPALFFYCAMISSKILRK